MTEFVKMIWKPESLEKRGLPNCEYPVPKEHLMEISLGNKPVPPEYLLCWMQEYSSTIKEGWEDLEPNIQALAQLIALNDDRETVTVQGDNWYLELGPIDLTGFIVTVQRGDRLLAAMAPAENEQLRLAVYAPLDARSLRRLFELARLPHPEHNIICLGYDTNWEYAQGMASRGTVSMYQYMAGDSYFSIWHDGLALDHEGNRDDRYWPQRSLTPLPATSVAMQLGIYYEHGDFD